MNKYYYTIQTTITETIYVTADNEDEAYEMAQEISDPFGHDTPTTEKVIHTETIDSGIVPTKIYVRNE